MRIGASRLTVLAALAHAHVYSTYTGAGEPAKEELDAAAAAVATAYALCPSFDALVPALLEGGPDGLALRCRLTPGVPCSPMLAQPTTGVAAALLKLGAASPFLAEYKYDGMRAAIHILPGGGVRLFTRAGGCCTQAFPDVAAAISEAVAGGSAAAHGAILDAELVALDDAGLIRPFQELATRARGAVAAADVSVKVCAFLFDCLASGGQSLIAAPLSERRVALLVAVPQLDALRGRVQLAESFVFEQRGEGDEAAVERAMATSLAARCEGLMLKSLSSGYEPDRRSASWLKLKKDYIAGQQTDLDLVPIGAWSGSGRKCAWFSPFLMAVYDRETETWQSVCRVMSGFSDQLYRELHAFYAEEGADRILPTKPPYYTTHEQPDFWLAPCAVWELRGADFSLSNVHCASAGLAPQGRGIALRFPRFIRARPDRSAEEATGPDALLELYRAQANRGGGVAEADE
jgi:DNA ligase-1